MEPAISLKELEKKAFRSVHQDGLLDLVFGLILFLLGLGQLLERQPGVSEGVATAVYTGLMLLIVAGFWILKRKVILPRIGSAKFGPSRRAKVRKVVWVLAASVGLGLAVFAVTATGLLPGGSGLTIPALFLVNCVVVFGAMAYFMEHARLYLYGWFYGLSLFLSEWLRPVTGYPLFWAVIPFSVVMVVIGSVLFARFLRDYPLPAFETAEGSE
jgi:hypothetical protein